MHTCRYIIGKIHTLLVTAGKVVSPKADSQAFAKLKPKIAKALVRNKDRYCSIPVKNASSFRYTRQTWYNMHRDIWNNTKNTEHSMVSSFFDEKQILLLERILNPYQNRCISMSFITMLLR